MIEFAIYIEASKKERQVCSSSLWWPETMDRRGHKATKHTHKPTHIMTTRKEHNIERVELMVAMAMGFILIVITGVDSYAGEYLDI